MFKAQTPAGKATYILRGAFTPNGKKNIAKVSVLVVGDVDRVVWDLTAAGGDAYSIDISPSSLSGGGASSSSIAIATTIAEATVSGAVGTVSYAWEQTEGADFWTIESPFTARTRFVATSVNSGETQLAEFTCTATDGAGRTASATVNATARNYGDPTGGTLEP